MSDPYASDGATDCISASATGIYTEGSFTYSSSIDSNVTGLYAKYSYDNGAHSVGLLPIMILMHGYAGNANNFIDADLRRWAARGFFCIAVGLRAKNGASGTTDASAREIYDIFDCLTYVRNSFSTIVSNIQASITGYSGGGGNTLASICKLTDTFNVFASFFGISDYGIDETYGWYNFGVSVGSNTLLDVDIGNSPTSNILPYIARDSRSAVDKIMYLGGWLHLLHDDSDTSVSVESSRQVVTSLVNKNLTNYTYTETNSGSTHRALHGHPNDHPSDLYPLEWIFARRARDSGTWSIPNSGSVLILGWIKTSKFEIWIGDENPRTTSSGGKNKTALLVYDSINNIYKLTSLFGNCYFYIHIYSNDYILNSYELNDNRTHIIDANSGIISEIENDLSTTEIAWLLNTSIRWNFLPTVPISIIDKDRATTWLQKDRRKIIQNS